MKKIKNLFERYEDGRNLWVKNLLNIPAYIMPEELTATRKWDGTACAVINGELYKRYDAKKGKTPPEGAIPCDKPDSVTGHWPHWVKVEKLDPGSKWHNVAWEQLKEPLKDGTYELIGEKFQGNPENIIGFEFKKHGDIRVDPFICSYDWILLFLKKNPTWEGLVIYKDGKPYRKIRRGDFKELTND